MTFDTSQNDECDSQLSGVIETTRSPAAPGGRWAGLSRVTGRRGDVRRRGRRRTRPERRAADAVEVDDVAGTRAWTATCPSPGSGEALAAPREATIPARAVAGEGVEREHDWSAMWEDLRALMRAGVKGRPHRHDGAARPRPAARRAAARGPLLRLPPGRAAVPGLRDGGPHAGDGGAQPVLVPDLPAGVAARRPGRPRGRRARTTPTCRRRPCRRPTAGRTSRPARGRGRSWIPARRP